MLLLSAALILPTAPTDILTATANPFGSGSHIVEDAICAVVADSDNLFPTAASRIGATVNVSVLVEVFPPFLHRHLAFLARPLIPFLAFVLRLMSFHKSACLGGVSRPIGRDV